MRWALELEDTSRPRIDKIFKRIEGCRLGIHDVSRVQQDAALQHALRARPRLGARHCGNPAQRTKSCLVLDANRSNYQKFLSDIAGQDILQHGNRPGKRSAPFATGSLPPASQKNRFCPERPPS